MAKEPASFSNPPDWLQLVTWSVSLSLALLSLAGNVIVLYLYAKDRLPSKEQTFFVLNMASCDFILCSVTMPAYIILILSSSTEYIGTTQCIFIIILSYIATDSVICIIFFYIIECYRLVYFGNVTAPQKDVSKAYIKTGALLSWVITVIMNVVLIDHGMAYEDFCYEGLPASLHGHPRFSMGIFILILIGTAVCAYPIARSRKSLVCPLHLWTRRSVSISDGVSQSQCDLSSHSQQLGFLELVRHPPLVTNEFVTTGLPLRLRRNNLEEIMEIPLDEREAEMEIGRREQLTISSAQRVFDNESTVRLSKTNSGTERSRGSLFTSGVSYLMESKGSSHFLELLVSHEGRNVVDGIHNEVASTRRENIFKELNRDWFIKQSFAESDEQDGSSTLKPKTPVPFRQSLSAQSSDSLCKPTEDTPGKRDSETNTCGEIGTQPFVPKKSNTQDKESQSNNDNTFPSRQNSFEKRDEERTGFVTVFNVEAQTIVSSVDNLQESEISPQVDKDQKLARCKRHPIPRLRGKRIRRPKTNVQNKVLPASDSPARTTDNLNPADGRYLTHKITQKQFRHKQQVLLRQALGSDVEVGGAPNRRKLRKNTYAVSCFRSRSRSRNANAVPLKSLFVFRHAFILVFITTLTWLPLLIYAYIHNVLRHSQSELYASPIHSFLHVLAWSRPCLTSILHWVWFIGRNNVIR